MATIIQQYAAGIFRKEIDQSNTLAAVGTSIGALVTRAPKGPANREVIIADYPTFVNTFGGPVFSASETPVYGYGPYAAEEFLNESNELHVVRITDDTDKYPMVRFKSTFSKTTIWSDETTGTSAIGREGISAVMDSSDPDTVTRIKALDDGYTPGDYLMVGALGPGTDNENLGVTIESFSTSCDFIFNFDDYPTITTSAQQKVFDDLGAGVFSGSNGLALFDSAISGAYNGKTSVDLLPVASQVIKLNVYSKNANQTWADINYKLVSSLELAITDMTPLETFYGSIGFLKDAKNTQLRLKDRVNGVSQYIYIATGTSNLPKEITNDKGIYYFDGGAISTGTGVAPADASAIMGGWDFFVDREYATVNILICTDSDTSVKQKVATIAANRMDCCAVGQSGDESALSVAQVLAQEQYGYKNPSYIGLYAGWDLKYDQANDRNLYVPKALYGAALFARVDRTGNTWDAPAGDPNGILTSKDQNHIFSFTDIGLLQKAGINTSRFLRSTGHTMWGQRTAQIKDSALNRINVRRLLIYIENTVELTMFPFLFNIINDARSRLRISTIIDNYLGSVVAGGGATAAQAICNEKNNTPDIIDASQMVIDLFVTPSKPVEVIQINTRITRTGVSFTETIL